MSICFETSIYLSQIAIFLKVHEIKQFSMCNKKINELLNPKYNQIINIIFLITILNEFFQIKTYNYNNFWVKYNLSENLPNFSADFGFFLKQLRLSFSKYEDKIIAKRIHDFLKIHIYLPDLRKDCFTLDFEGSSITQLICYDINSRLMHTYNFYAKQINIDNQILHKEKEGKIKILRENLIFEDCLINFSKIFNEFCFNNYINDFVNENIINYRYENLLNIYNNNNKIVGNNSQLKDIINCILWISNIFVLYCKFNYEYINGLFDHLKKEDLLEEFITKKNDLINCGLLINSAFENINIIINLLSIYKNIYDEYIHKCSDFSLLQLSSTESKPNNPQKKVFDIKDYADKIISPKGKFSLYNLFVKCVDHFYTQKLQKIFEVFGNVSKDYFKEVFTNDLLESNNNQIKEDKIEDEEDEYLKDEIFSEDNDDDFSLDTKLTTKELIESMMNAMVDCCIDGYNANGINHTGLRVNETYINYENSLAETLVNQINESINKENIPISQCFRIIDKITRVEGNSKNLYLSRDSLTIIRRSKKKLMIKAYCAIFPKLIELLSNDFHERIKNGKLFLNTSEKLKYCEYKCDLDALTKNGEKNVTKNVENECKKIKEYLIKNNNLSSSEYHLTHEYIECHKIGYVDLLIRFLWNYYKQLEIYKERDDQVKYYLAHDKNVGNNMNQNDNDTRAINNIEDQNKRKAEIIVLWQNVKIRASSEVFS